MRRSLDAQKYIAKKSVYRLSRMETAPFYAKFRKFVDFLDLRKKFLNYLTKRVIVQATNVQSISIQILIIPLLSECHEDQEFLCS